MARNSLINNTKLSPPRESSIAPREKSCKNPTKHNPFEAEDVEEQWRRLYEKQEGWENVDTGEYAEMRRAARQVRIMCDSRIYTKLFKAGKEIVMRLSSHGKNLFLLIAFDLEMDERSTILYGDYVVKECGFSKATMYRAINELIEVDILRKKLGSSVEFHLNPNFMYNGNRANLKKE